MIRMPFSSQLAHFQSASFPLLELPFVGEGRHPKSLIGKNFCAYLVDLRNSSTPFKGTRKTLIDVFLDGYNSARYGTGVSVFCPNQSVEWELSRVHVLAY